MENERFRKIVFGRRHFTIKKVSHVFSGWLENTLVPKRGPIAVADCVTINLPY
jgi:hypothetical protein